MEKLHDLVIDMLKQTKVCLYHAIVTGFPGTIKSDIGNVISRLWENSG